MLLHVLIGLFFNGVIFSSIPTLQFFIHLHVDERVDCFWNSVATDIVMQIF